MMQINSYQPNYFLKKPYSCSELERVVASIYFKENKSNNTIKLKITDMLHNLGIPSNLKGYSYIRDGIEMMYNDTSVMGAITKELYPRLARSYETTSSRVERAIRHAIEISWSRGDYDYMEELSAYSPLFPMPQTPVIIKSGVRFPTNIASTCCRPSGMACLSGSFPSKT